MKDNELTKTIHKARDYFTYYDADSEMLLEANVRENIVVELLVALGYPKEKMVRESHPTVRRRQAVDICITGLGDDEEELIVEVKRGNIDLNHIHIEQTLSYLEKRTKFEWAILTNGKKYLLLNKK